MTRHRFLERTKRRLRPRTTRTALIIAVAICLAGSLSLDGEASLTQTQAPALGGTRGANPADARLLQFNVMNGATGGRAAGVIAVIKASGADIITLDEVNDEDVFNEVAAATGFHSVYVQANDGYSVGLLSRYPIDRCQQFRQVPIRHAAYGCRIVLKGRSWWIFGAHLYPFSESVRIEEISFLLRHMRQHLPSPVILAGDLNTDTPGETDGMGTLVIPLLRKAGFADAFRDVHSWHQDRGFTVSTPGYGDWEHRPDYVFHSNATRTVGARVISSVAGVQWPSDHAAVFVELAPRRLR